MNNDANVFEINKTNFDKIQKATKEEIFTNCDAVMEKFVEGVKAITDLTNAIASLRLAINIALLEFVRRGCLKEYLDSRKDKFSGMLKSFIDENSAEDFARLINETIAEINKGEEKNKKFFSE